MHLSVVVLGYAAILRPALSFLTIPLNRTYIYCICLLVYFHSSFSLCKCNNNKDNDEIQKAVLCKQSTICYLILSWMEILFEKEKEKMVEKKTWVADTLVLLLLLLLRFIINNFMKWFVNFYNILKVHTIKFNIEEGKNAWHRFSIFNVI